MKLEEFYDTKTGTFSYVVFCENTKYCAVIDPVADFDITSNAISYEFSDRQINFIEANNLSLKWILETHIHADHLSSANYFRQKLGGKIAINENYHQIKDYFANYYDIELKNDAFDYFLKDGEIIKIGELEVKIIFSPGHTPTCLSYLIADNLFVGDLLLPPYIGCARCDFKDGSAARLYDSIQKIYELDDKINVYICHDYPKDKDMAKSNNKLKEHKEKNVMIDQNISREDFISKREEKDARMEQPRLIYPAIKANINGGV